MASPITWRNVEGPDLGQAMRGMGLAQVGFNAGFDKLNEVVKDQEKVGFDNWDAQKQNNTQAFLEQMRQYRTPEELAAAQASGQLDTQKYSAQIDRAAVGAALDGRESILQKRGTDGINYKTAVDTAADAPILDQITAATLAKDFDRANALKEQLRRQGVGAKIIDDQQVAFSNRDWQEGDRGRQLVKFGQELIDAENKNKMAPVLLDNARLAGQASRATIAARRAEASAKQATTDANNVVTGIYKAYTAAVEDYNKKASDIATQFGFKLNKAGEPIFPADASPDVLKNYRDTLEKQVGPIPSASAYQAQALKSLQGMNLSPAALITARDQIGKLVDSGTVLNPADQKELENGVKKIDERNKQAQDKNLFYVNPKTQAADQAEIYKTIDTKITDSEGTKNRIKNNITQWMDVGFNLELPGGGTTGVKIPPKLMALALASNTIEKDAWAIDPTGNRTSERLEAFLQKALFSPEYSKMREQADILMADPNGDKLKEKHIASYLNTPGMTISPRVLNGNLNSALAAAEKKTLQPKQ